MYDVIYCKKSVTLKMVYNKKKIQIFGMNMPVISSREARKCRAGEGISEPKVVSEPFLYHNF